MDGILINGQKVIIPGVTTRINATELAGRGPAGGGVIACLYEGERGGEPWVPSIFYNPATLRRTLPARIATIVGKLAFAPSKDEQRIPRGASAVVMVRVNPAERSTLQLIDANAVACCDVKARDWGNYGNDIIVQVAAGTNQGRKLTVALGSTTETFDDIGVLDAMTALYVEGSLPADVSIVSMLGVVNPLAGAGEPGFYVNAKIQVVGGTAAFDPRAWMAFDGNQGDATNRVKFTFVDQNAPKTITIKGLRRDTGATVTDEIAVIDDQTTAYSTYSMSEITEIDCSGMAGNVDIEFSAFNLSITQYTTVAAVRDRVVSKGRGFDVTFGSPRKLLPIADLDYALNGGAGNDIVAGGAGHTFTADLYHFVTSVASSIVTVERSATGRNVAAVQGPSNLTGGLDGTAGTGAGGDWDKGLAALRALEVSHVTARTGDKAVHALISDHIAYCNGAGKRERIAILGAPAGTGKSTATTGLYARTAALNSRNIALCAQETAIYDENGQELWVEPFDTAILAAGCDAGTNAGDSITWATVDVLGFRDQPNHGTSAWAVIDDLADLLDHNLLLLEQRPGATPVYQWARDVTTHQIDDNPIFCSIFANRKLNDSTKNVRRRLEVAIGRGSVVMSAAGVKRLVLSELRRQKSAGEIKDYDAASINPEDLGNGYRVSWRVAPVEAIYFIDAEANAARMPQAA